MSLAPVLERCGCSRGPRPVTQSGLTGETIKGDPVIAAVLILRRELGCYAPPRVQRWFDTDKPYFVCPWSKHPPAERTFLAHGPAYRDASGVANLFDRDADGTYKASGRCSHCPAWNGHYFIKPIALALLVRRIELPDGRPGAAVTDDIASGAWR